VDNTTLKAFTTSIAGNVALPDSEDYATLRRSFTRNGSPAVVVQVKTHGDIAKAIQFAVDNQLKLSIRSGGHGFSGLSTNEGGVVIDLTHFNTVEVLDADQGLVRIGAGAKWGTVAQTLAGHGLALSSGDTSSVGVGGLTLGGGIGWLVRKYGLTIDSVVGAEILTADGRTLRLSEDENADLFWAIRGGGGNFGVVTSFDFAAQHLRHVVGGLINYDLAEAKSVLTKWVQAMRNAPEELNSSFILFPGFGPQMPAQLMVYVCYGGEDEAAAKEAIQPLLELGTITHQDLQTKPYYQMLEEAMPPADIIPVSESGFVKSLDADVIETITANFGRPGTPIFQIRSLGGAVARVPADSTAFAHRDYEAIFWMTTMMPATTPAEQAKSMREKAWQPVKEFVAGAYINFLSSADDTSVTTAYPTDTYARLANVKATYDPNNVFNQNHNVKPKVGELAS
jgi:FAD/FMN-containing dehydrogenase